MRLSALLCAAGFTTAAAFAPIGSQSGVSSSGLRAAENNFEDAPVVATFDPLNLATEEPASGKSGSAMSIAAATTAAWVASADVASANNSPDWGVFEGVSSHMCFVPNVILDLYAGLSHACIVCHSNFTHIFYVLVPNLVLSAGGIGHILVRLLAVRYVTWAYFCDATMQNYELMW